MKKYIIIFSALLLVICLTYLNVNQVIAWIGVGVGTGKIQVTEKLKPGQIYILPSISVLNTGDEKGNYKVSIAYHEKQPEYIYYDWKPYTDGNLVNREQLPTSTFKIKVHLKKQQWNIY